MAYFFHKDRGFLHSGVHKEIPEDAHPISDEYHMYLIKTQGNGQTISWDDNGFPILIDSPGPSDEENIASARADREGMLRQTDWTQLCDIPEKTRKRFAEYRQKLRDVPQQEGFPHDIKWPIHPDEEKS